MMTIKVEFYLFVGLHRPLLAFVKTPAFIRNLPLEIKV